MPDTLHRERLQLSPMQFVLLGARSDLARKFLLPTLYGLWCSRSLPEPFRIVALDAASTNTGSYRSWVRSALDVQDDPRCRRFLELIHFVRADVSSETEMSAFAEKLRESEEPYRGNMVFYLALRPANYVAAVTNLGRAGLVPSESANPSSFRRLVVEKPFGSDAASARELDSHLRAVFPDDSIYRMDHYQGKGMVQFLFSLRRYNALIHSVLTSDLIDHVQINALEDVDVGARGGFYDANGVFRDMFQNHLLELLVLLGMEMPTEVSPNALEVAQLAFLDHLPRLHRNVVARFTRAGQYDGGTIGSRKIIPYRSTEGVSLKSRTPTYGALKLVPTGGRFRGVPFFLRSGKALRQKSTNIVICYRQPNWLSGHAGDVPSNRVVISIDPEQQVRMRINGRVDGERGEIEQGEFALDYHGQFGRPEPLRPYELLLLRVFAGVRVPFKSGRVLERSWEVIDPIVAHYEHRAERLPAYAPGSWGPVEADSLLGRGRSWVS